MKTQITCPFCQIAMVEKELQDGDTFWKCPDCGSEFWPSSKDLSWREVRELMKAPAPLKKKGSSGRRRSRFKAKKPGQKWLPWQG